ncbi:MAG: IclR family transcriptional regulator [Candidimonas sp.]|nr:MAG: IclR family transcriptional regulator [Candidimonas sp.]TAM25149.1 MAG: IclR family transcriptional regulator [Candidimonas sp.]
MKIERHSAHPSTNPLFNQSLEKGLAVIRAFSAERRSMTIAEVADCVNINKSSAQRMIYTLEQLGYLKKHPRTQRYLLTVRALQLGFNYLTTNTLIDVANPFLSELSNTTQETICLTEADALEMVYIARFVSARYIPIHMPIGSRIPLYCTGSGRAYLSALAEDDAVALLRASHRVAHTMYTRTSEAELLELLRNARRQGYAVNEQELFLGDMTLAAPIISGSGQPVAVVHIVAPTSRWTLAEAQTKLAPALLTCARSLSNSVRAMD